MDNVRTIVISKNDLDPLADWSRSKTDYGDRVGNTTPPEILNFQARNEDYQDGLRYYVQPQDATDFIEGIFNPEGDRLPGALQQFYKELYRGNFWGGNRNKFIYVATPVGPDELIYKSFSENILQNVIDTASTIISVTEDDDDFNLRRHFYDVSLDGEPLNPERYRESMARRFLNVLDDSGAGRVEIREDQGARDLSLWWTMAAEGRFNIGTGIRNNNGDVVYKRITMHDLVYGAIHRLDRRFPRPNPDYVVSLAKYLAISALTKTQTPLVPEQAVVAILDKLEHHQFFNLDLKIETPYVKNSDNFRFLNSVPPGTQVCSIAPTYRFYNERYERAASSDIVPEIALPNLYTRRFYQNANPQQVAGSQEANQNTNVENYLKSLSLSTTPNNIAQQRGQQYSDDLRSSFEGGEIKNFYETYSQLIEDEPALEDTITRKNSTSLTGIREIFDNGDPFGLTSAPMSLNVSFVKEEVPPNPSFENHCIVGTLRDPSVALLNNLFSGDVQPDNVDFAYSTEYFLDGIERQSPHMPVTLPVYLVLGDNTIFSTAPAIDEYEMTLFQTRASIPTAIDLVSTKGFLIGNSIRKSRKTHREIIDGVTSQSEVLGYRLEKFNPANNQLLSNIIIGKYGSGKQTYEDAQIKYGQEYSYALREYRFVYGTPYNAFTLTYDMSIAPLLAFYGVMSTEEAKGIVGNTGFSFVNFMNASNEVVLIDIPIYDDSWNRFNIFNNLPTDGLFAGDGDILAVQAEQNMGAGGIAYPKSKVLDFPPTAPTLQFFPKAKVNNKVDVNINTQSGKVGTILNEEGNWDNVLKIITIGDNDEKINKIKEFQDRHSDGGLGPDEMRFKQKGLIQTRNIILYKTTSINTDVESYEEMYSSFNPAANSDVSVQKFTTKDDVELDGITRILSYDITENIDPNRMYYFTCVVEDIHGSISNPSMIYQVRLISDKGLIVPEIKTVYPTGSKNKNSQKNLIRYIQVEASNIQTFPVSEGSGQDLVNFRSLGKSLNVPGKSIEDQGYILRFVSKDTGRKFDLKLNFVVRIDGGAMGDDT